MSVLSPSVHLFVELYISVNMQLPSEVETTIGMITTVTQSDNNLLRPGFLNQIKHFNRRFLHFISVKRNV